MIEMLQENGTSFPKKQELHFLWKHLEQDAIPHILVLKILHKDNKDSSY